MTRRSFVAAVLVPIAVTFAVILVVSRAAPAEPTPSASSSPVAESSPSLPPVPVPGHEMFGFVPYWEMDDGIAAHVGQTDLTTLALFSVTHKKNGSLAIGENGYRKITGRIGEALIETAHDRGARVELVYTSFGTAKNAAFFASLETQDRLISGLVALVEELGIDGVNVDVEQLDPADIPAYGSFVGRLRSTLRAAVDDGQVSVATTANFRGSEMALAASTAGADRIFMMGYDYRVAGSDPGASAPLARRDGNMRTLSWSLDLYRDIGVPADRTILGLPLYGMSWPVTGPEPGALASGRGDVWVPRQNLATLADPTATPTYDPLESVEVLVVQVDDGWRAIYFDSATSLAPKLALADDRGLAGAGFWAIGYERGQPAYTRLIETFRAGTIRSAPVEPRPSDGAP